MLLLKNNTHSSVQHSGFRIVDGIVGLDSQGIGTDLNVARTRAFGGISAQLEFFLVRHAAQMGGCRGDVVGSADDRTAAYGRLCGVVRNCSDLVPMMCSISRTRSSRRLAGRGRLSGGSHVFGNLHETRTPSFSTLPIQQFYPRRERNGILPAARM